ncbi:MAG TPA: ATP-binding cassette domain-containing protein, partial [Baekduia sp.]|nr:ATP-binding cassette domain-containing protein [Baekduia sp.]
MAIVERHKDALERRASPRDRAPAVVEFRNVSKRYDSGDVGLQDVSFAIPRGAFVFLVGSSGSGKSTLMRLLIKEHDPTSGVIRVGGRDLAEVTRSKVPHYRRNIGIVFQDFKLLPNRTVHDNVAYALQVTGASRKEIREKVPDILRLTGLSTKLHNMPDQLSGGEQQRVAVARALVMQPSLLLADEPTGDLDETTADALHALLREMHAEFGLTAIIATHNPRLAQQCDRILRLESGQLKPA